MKKEIIRTFLFLVVSMVLAPLLFPSTSTYEKLMERAEETGYAKVIIKLDVNNIKTLTEKSRQYKTVEPGRRFPAGGLQADLDLQNAISTVTDSVLHQLNGKGYQLNHTYDTLPYLALDASPEALAVLPGLPEILDIFEDRARPLEKPFPGDDLSQPLLDSSVGVIGADNAWDMGYTGSGWYVAILDTGIRRTHRFFQEKTIVEACFSADGECPNNGTEMSGTGAAAHYPSTYDGYDHGTHVTGIAAGNNDSLAGVAKNSNIIAVQVFTPFPASEPSCGGTPCVLSYDSDQVKGLEHLYTLRSTYSIAAANMSLGGGFYSSYCDSEPHKAAIDNLKAVRIATVVATGNDGYCGFVSSPACISSAVAVGASSDSDVEAWFNNWHATLQELFAPGVSIYSSTGVSDSSYQGWSGTSMAAPHVTGAWALLRQASPTASVDTLLNILRSTGPLITTLCWTGGTCPRIQLEEAIAELVVQPNFISLNRSHLNFTAISNGAATDAQYLRVDNTGSGTLQWTAVPDVSWLHCSPTSGTDTGVIAVSVTPAGLTIGTYTGTITVADSSGASSAQMVTVTLKVKNASQDQAPFGTFETPLHGSTVCSSVPVTGWVLDDVGVASVEIYLKQGNNLVYIGDAVFVDGARPDVEGLYPNFPAGYQAGWGYMMLSYFLPNEGNGTFDLTAIATDLAGKQTTLGSKTVTVDNANAVKPFGAIDSPGSSGEASGTNYRNSGWVLTPLPNKIPEDGSTINVFIDGVNKGRPIYNIYRADIAALFPAHANSSGAHAYFDFDTTAYSNGIHTIAWTAADDAGNTDGIGSRFFSILNAGTSVECGAGGREQGAGGVERGAGSVGQGAGIPERSRPDPGPVDIIKGYKENSEPQKIVPDDNGIINIEIRELERVVINLDDEFHGNIERYSGFLAVGTQLRPLPAGSFLDAEKGIFYWQPGPGYLRTYELVFIKKEKDGAFKRKKIIMEIVPRFP